MVSTLCRTVLLTNHYKALLINIEEFQADSEPHYDYIMEVNKFMGSGSVPSSPMEDSESPSTTHTGSDSVGSFDKGPAGPSSNTKSTEEPMNPNPPPRKKKENPFRLSQLHFGLSYPWSDPKGDELFSNEIKRASIASLHGTNSSGEELGSSSDYENETSTAHATSAEHSNFSTIQASLDQQGVEQDCATTVETQTWTDISLQDQGTTPPWVEEYHDRMAKTPTRSDFEDSAPTYEAWSPGKYQSLVDAAMNVDYYLDLPDDFPELQRFDSKQAVDPTDQISNQRDKNNINQALLEPEPLEYMPSEHEMTERIDQNPAPATGIPAVVVHSPTDDQDVAPDEKQVVDEDEMTEEDYRRLWVQVLRSIVANEGGLPALPSVIVDDEDEEEEEDAK